MWDLVGVDRDRPGGEEAFNAGTGRDLLAAHFSEVERIDEVERFHVSEAVICDYIRSTRFAALADNVPKLPDGLLVTAAGSVFIATR
jgi:hypothetical protein